MSDDFNFDFGGDVSSDDLFEGDVSGDDDMFDGDFGDASDDFGDDVDFDVPAVGGEVPAVVDVEKQSEAVDDFEAESDIDLDNFGDDIDFDELSETGESSDTGLERAESADESYDTVTAIESGIARSGEGSEKQSETYETERDDNVENELTSDDFVMDDDDEIEASESEEEQNVEAMNRFEFNREPSEKHEQSEAEDVDFDAIWDEAQKTEDGVPVVDMAGMGKVQDDGDPVCIAIAQGQELVYVAHGTEGRLGFAIRFLGAALGGRLVHFKLEGEDIEKLKDDPIAFTETFKKHLEV